MAILREAGSPALTTRIRQFGPKKDCRAPIASLYLNDVEIMTDGRVMAHDGGHILEEVNMKPQAVVLAFILFAAFFNITSPILAADGFGNPNDFVGNWKNVKRNTNSLKRIKIQPASQIFVDVILQIYATCGSHGECDWGSVNGNAGPSGSRTIKAQIDSTTNQGYVFAQRDLTLRLNSDDTMDFDMETDFVMAGDHRPNYVSRGKMRRY